MLAKFKSGHGPAKDGTSFMSDSQLADYLADLRTDRTARLNGTRPAPPSRYESVRKTAARIPDTTQDDRSLMPGPLRLRPPPPPKEIDASQVRGTLSTSPSVIYLEDGVRQTERQEAHSLRMALEGMSSTEEERIHDAAQAEASELVLEHIYPHRRAKEGAYMNPDLRTGDRTVHMRQGSHSDTTARTEFDTIPTLSTKPSVGASNFGQRPSNSPIPVRKKSYSGLANAVAADIANIKRRVSSGGSRIVSAGRRKASIDKHSFPNANDKIYEEPETIREEGSKKVRFAVPDVEQTHPVEPEPAADVPRHVRKNPFARVRQDNLERANSVASNRPGKLDRVEIQKNPPTQSRRPWYMSNRPSFTPSKEVPTLEDPAKKPEETQDHKDGKEIRSDDIRAATSMKRKDRSPNLPQPTAVSDATRRPIVSFQNDWQRAEEERRDSTSSVKRETGSLYATGDVRLSESRSSGRNTNAIATPPRDSRTNQSSNSAPIPSSNIPNGIPILNLPDNDDGSSSRVLSEEPDIPQINILQCDSAAHPKTTSKRHLTAAASPMPVINLEGPQADQTTPRPLPVPGQGHYRSMSKPHVTTYQKRNAVLCAQCALPIAGRIVTAAGERFHPECFACHQCGINLECVAFYPEPDKKYYERIARIQQRMQGFDIVLPDGSTEEDARRLEHADGDESLRFFCHLDFHELFSPRCKSCKTPIEGEVVVACGAEWHVGHFFCAQCGDPFDSTMPFVEKDGYAWCLGCHTNRYSPKCKKCRKPVTDIVVNALGHDWHAECFCCCECGGGFDDGQYFLRGDSTDPVCIRCEDRRLKA